jgi:hypothetical protein
MNVVQERSQSRDVVNTVMNLRVSGNVEKFLSSCTTGGILRRAQLHAVSEMDCLCSNCFFLS